MTVHSFSSISYFESCPRKYHQVKITKAFKEKPYQATELGLILHSAFERTIMTGARLPDGLIQYQPEIDALVKLPGIKQCEMKLAVAPNCSTCDYWDKGAALRGAADFIHIDGDKALVVDFKTGKVNPKPDQLHVLALMLMQKYPHIKTVRGVLMFVEHKVLHTETYSSDALMPMWAYWVQKMKRINDCERTGIWPANQSGLCKAHCPVLSCEHNGANS